MKTTNSDESKKSSHLFSTTDVENKNLLIVKYKNYQFQYIKTCDIFRN